MQAQREGVIRVWMKLPQIESGCCVQVFSAMVMSFAHGSNDVANAMGEHMATCAFLHMQP